MSFNSEGEIKTFKISKSWGSLWLLDLPCKKCLSISKPCEEMNNRQWVDIFEVLKGKKKICQPRNLDPGKLSFNSEGEIKTFQISKSWGSLWLLDLPCKKLLKQFKAIWRNEQLNKSKHVGNKKVRTTLMKVCNCTFFFYKT